MYKLIILLATLIIVAGCNTQTTTSNTPVQEIKQIEIPPEPKEPVEHTTTIAAIGDILIHNSVYEDAKIAHNQYDFTNMFAKVKPYLENANITVANSESIIGGQALGLSSYPRFNSPLEVGDALKYVGVDVVNLANNHTLDRGEQAIINATNYWDQLGITYIGSSPTKAASHTIKTVTSNNIVFSFLGYTYGTNGLQPPIGKEYLVNYINREKMAQDIRQAKEQSDIVVVNVHVGNEYERNYNEYQDQLAQQLSDYGADIIFAHHTHVLQPVKWYEGINGNKTFVIHSLGNFLSAQDQLYRRIGTILQLNVTKTIVYDITGHEYESIRISNPQLLPTYVKFENWRDYKIIPMYQLTDNDLPNAHYIYNEIKNHMTQYVPDVQFIEQSAISAK